MRLEGPWHILLTEPCDDWDAAPRIDLGVYPNAKMAAEHARSLGRVPDSSIYVSAPISNMGIELVSAGSHCARLNNSADLV